MLHIFYYKIANNQRKYKYIENRLEFHQIDEQFARRIRALYMPTRLFFFSLVKRRQGYLLNSARACVSIAIVSLSVDADDFGELFSDIFLFVGFES